MITVAFFVSTDGAKVGEPIVICKNKNPRFLACVPDAVAEVSYF